MNGTTYNINIGGDALSSIKKITSNTKRLDKSMNKVNDRVKRTTKLFKGFSQIEFASLTQNIQNMGRTFENVIQPGLKFEQSMKELQALTGVTGQGLKQIGQFARENAKEFGGDAAKSVETYKILLSKLGPELAKSPKLLKAMGNDVSTLSKTMGGDTKGAVDALTTSFNQYGLSIDKPQEAVKHLTSMMNVMAAGAKAGSSEVIDQKAALQQVGGMAMRANVSFEELNGSLQVLDKAGKKDSEGGVQLRNVLATLAQGKFMPKDTLKALKSAGVDITKLSDKSLSLTDRLRALKPVADNSGLMIKLFGRESIVGAQALIQGTDKVDKFTKAVTGTTSAQDQAKVVMQSVAEKTKRLQSKIDDLKISFFNATGAAAPFIKVGMQALEGIVTMAPGIQATAGMINKLRKSQKLQAIASKIAAVAQRVWNVVMEANPIGAIIAGIVALTGVVYGLVKAFHSSSAAQELANNVQQKAIDKAADEITQITILTDKIKDSKDARKEAVQALIDKYPQLLDKYKTEEGIIKNINKIQKDLSDNALKRAKKQATAELFKETVKQRIKLQLKAKQNVGQSGISEFIQGFYDYDNTHSRLVERGKELGKKSKILQKMMSKQSGNNNSIKDGDKYIAKKDQYKNGTDSMIPNNLGTSTNVSSSSSSSSEGSSSNVKKRNINVKIETLVKNIIVKSTTLANSADEIKKQVAEAMVGAVRDFETAI